MHIEQIWRYPVKSMAGEPLTKARIGADGVDGDRTHYVLDARDQIVSARTRPALLGHRATVGPGGDVLVDGLPWDSDEVADLVRRAAGPDTQLVAATGPERFDILPLLVVTDGALAVLGHDGRRLRPNVVVAGVPGLDERTWEQSLLETGDAVIALADLRGRCIMTTWHPDTQAQDVGVRKDIHARFEGTFALKAWVGRPGTIAVGDAVARSDRPRTIDRPRLGRFAS